MFLVHRLKRGTKKIRQPFHFAEGSGAQNSLLLEAHRGCRDISVADVHRGDGRRNIVRADGELIAFVLTGISGSIARISEMSPTPIRKLAAGMGLRRSRLRRAIGRQAGALLCFTRCRYCGVNLGRRKADAIRQRHCSG